MAKINTDWEPINFYHALELIVGDSIGEEIKIEKFEEVKKDQADALSNILNISKADTVLDLGCGIGEITKHIAEKCKIVYALDISKKMLEYAKKRNDIENIIYGKCNGINLKQIIIEEKKNTHQVKKNIIEFKENLFDKGYAGSLFFHLQIHEIYNYLKELKRILKPRALFYFEILDLKNDNAFERFKRDCETLTYIKYPASCLKYMDKTILKKITKKLNFKLKILNKTKEGVLQIKTINNK